MHPAIKVGAILKNKKGETVEILKTNIINCNYPILGLVNNDHTEFYTPNGRKLLSTKTNSDLDLETILDLSKPIQTRDGLKAILLEIKNGIFWVAIETDYGWSAYKYPISGKALSRTDDVVNL